MRSLFITLLLAVSAYSYSWQNITSGCHPYFNGTMHWINNPSTASHDTLYVATPGGLLIRSGANDRMWTVADGYLSSNSLSAITLASEGGVWVGGTNASITRIDPMTGHGERIDLFRDEPGVLEIQMLREFNRVLFVSTNAGITRVSFNQSLRRWVIDATYRDFGALGRLPLVFDIGLFHDTLWIATDRGVAFANWNDPLLQSPSAWSTIGNFANQEVYSFQVLNDDFYVGAASGCYRIDEATPIQLRAGMVSNIVSYRDSLAMLTTAGIFRVSNNRPIGDETRYTPFIAGSATDLFTFHLETDSTFEKYATYDPDGDRWLASQAQTALYPGLTGAARLPNGGLAVAGGGIRTRGVYIYNNGQWDYRTPLSSPEEHLGFYRQDLNVIKGDVLGNVWAGTNGGGLAVFYPDSMQHFDETAATGAHLREYDANREPVVSTIDFLSNGRVIVLNYDPIDFAPLVVLPEGAGASPGWENGTWRRIGTADGLPGSKMNRLVVDPWDRLWMGSTYSPTQRLVMYDFQGTVDQISDDIIRSFGEESGLPTNLTMSSMAISAEAVLYMATSNGLYYGRITDDPTNIRFYPLSVPISNVVVSLAADATGQIWVGTDRGLALLSADGQNWLETFTQTSDAELTGLSSNAIGSMQFSPKTGELFIVNEQGLAVLTTPFRQYDQTLGKLEPAPNPFINDGQNSLQFGRSGLVANADVRLFTVSGLLVRKLRFVEAAGTGWDGKNDAGERVASGVYYIVVSTPEGKTSCGKVAVIKP